jgi:hypothetical protein
MLRAAFIGAVLACVCLFLFAALYGAVMIHLTVMEGAIMGAIAGVIMCGPILFPCVALAGAAMGIILRGSGLIEGTDGV